MQKLKISTTVKLVSLISLWLFAFLELYFFKIDYSPAGYSATLLLIFFGLWRIEHEKDFFQKVRISTILSLFCLFWLIIPLGFKVKVPLLGGEWGSFPGLHTVGSLVFFLYIGVVFLFGKRVDCGWCCPCVTARETIGFAFRDTTPRSDIWWRLRHLKWISFSLLIAYLVFMIVDAGTAYDRIGKTYYDFITYPYYASFFIIPLTGNRNFCRVLCPFAALWGTLSIAGFYKITAKKDACTGCRLCEQVCDMGIPIADMVRKKGEVRTIECMGCGRCLTACPQQVLSFQSFWTVLKKGFRRS
ncbi:MAG: 4Fe-4S dicluster domain-containing protein [Pseudomonadota bacterium]